MATCFCWWPRVSIKIDGGYGTVVHCFEVLSFNDLFGTVKRGLVCENELQLISCDKKVCPYRFLTHSWQKVLYWLFSPGAEVDFESAVPSKKRRGVCQTISSHVASLWSFIGLATIHVIRYELMDPFCSHDCGDYYTIFWSFDRTNTLRKILKVHIHNVQHHTYLKKTTKKT